MTLQHFAVQLVQQLRIAQLDRVAVVPWQLGQEGVQLLGPLQRIGQVLAAHRLELEHETAGVVPKRPRVREQHRVLEQLGVQEVGVALPGEIAPAAVLVQAPGRDPVPHLAHTREPGREMLRVSRQLLLAGRVVKSAVDPYRAEQRIPRVFLEPPRGLQAAILPVVDLALPAVVGPGGRAELDVGWELSDQLHQFGPWGGRRGVEQPVQLSVRDRARQRAERARRPQLLGEALEDREPRAHRARPQAHPRDAQPLQLRDRGRGDRGQDVERPAHLSHECRDGVGIRYPGREQAVRPRGAVGIEPPHRVRDPACRLAHLLEEDVGARVQDEGDAARVRGFPGGAHALHLERFGKQRLAALPR